MKSEKVGGAVKSDRVGGGGSAAANEIVVYQPNETMWLTQSQMAEMFGCTVRNVRMHLANIYACHELEEIPTRKDFFLVRKEGSRKVSRNVTCYNLDAIISVGCRVNSVLGVKFRIWATKVIKAYLLNGYAVNNRINQLEDKMDRRLAKHEQDIVDLRERVDFVVQSALPAPEMVFMEGAFLAAHGAIRKIVKTARRRLVLAGRR